MFLVLPVLGMKVSERRGSWGAFEVYGMEVAVWRGF
jgi:hypothetical protein